MNKRPALRVDDPGIHAACCGTNTWTATKGSATVFINGKSAHRMGDQTRHCGGDGKLIEGSPNVIVGDSGGGGAAAASTSAGRSSSNAPLPGAHGGASAGGRSGTGAANAARATPASASPIARDPEPAGMGARSSSASTKLSFIDLKLVDSEGQPVPFARYRVTGSDGATFAGALDARGRARVDGLPEGTCDVTFPDFHDDDWNKA